MIALLALLLWQAPTPNLNVESFETVWKTVREKHWDPKLNGVDWQKVHDDLRPRIDKAKSLPEARAVIQEMIGRLKQSHFAIIPSEAYEQMQPGSGSREGVTGIDVRLIGGRVLVTSVSQDSPAANVGVRPGWEVLAVDGKELAPALAHIRSAFKTPDLARFPARSMVLSRLSGEPGSTVKVRFRGSQSVELTVGRAQPPGMKVQLGFLPPLYVLPRWRKLDGNAGYLTFNLFMDVENVMKTAVEAITSCADCRGFVVDLRGNPGGIAGMAMGLAGFFIAEKGQRLGTMHTRDTTVRLTVLPRPEQYPGPLAILVDSCSASTSEIFAGGMHDLKRAHLFGTRTAGAALPSIIVKLPNGDGFQYAFADYISEGGKPLEGQGVAPDVEVDVTRESLLQGRDAVLDAALGWIEKQGVRQ